MVTVLQAKAQLAGYTENGICPTDSRFLPRLIEADRRLYDALISLGTLARYAVATSVAGGQTFFLVPDALEQPSRVSKWSGTGITPTTNGVLITDGVGAFVGQTGSLLPLIYEPGNLRKIYVPPDVAAVDVTAKKIFEPPVVDTDNLNTNDIPALKLMLLAIWRENNDQLDLATALENKAIARLKEITDRAIEEARRMSYQTTNLGIVYGTLGWARAKLATDLRQGVHHDETMLLDLINKAEDLLVARKNLLLQEGRFGVYSGIPHVNYTYLIDDNSALPVPDYQTLKLAVLSLVAQNVGDPNAIQASQAFESQAYDLLDKRLRTELAERRFNQYQTDFEVYQDCPDSFGYFRTRLALDIKDGLMLSNQELIRLINQAEEYAMTQGRYKEMTQNYQLVVPGSGEIKLPRIVDSVLQVSLNGRPVPVWSGEFEFHENGPGHTSCGDSRVIDRGIINGHRHYYVVNACPPACAVFRIKVRYLPKRDDDERMAVTNYPAMKKLVESFMTTDLNTGIMLRKEAEQILNKELTQHQGSNRVSLQVQGVGSFGSVPHLI